MGESRALQLCVHGQARKRRIYRVGWARGWSEHSKQPRVSSETAASFLRNSRECLQKQLRTCMLLVDRRRAGPDPMSRCTSDADPIDCHQGKCRKSKTGYPGLSRRRPHFTRSVACGPGRKGGRIKVSPSHSGLGSMRPGGVSVALRRGHAGRCGSATTSRPQTAAGSRSARIRSFASPVMRERM